MFDHVDHSKALKDLMQREFFKRKRFRSFISFSIRQIKRLDEHNHLPFSRHSTMSYLRCAFVRVFFFLSFLPSSRLVSFRFVYKRQRVAVDLSWSSARVSHRRDSIERSATRVLFLIAMSFSFSFNNHLPKHILNLTKTLFSNSKLICRNNQMRNNFVFVYNYQESNDQQKITTD